MVKNLPEDDLINEVANNRIGYMDFRKKHYFSDSAKYRLAYLHVYHYKLVTEREDGNMELTSVGNEVYLSLGFAYFKNYKDKERLENLKAKTLKSEPLKYQPFYKILWESKRKNKKKISIIIAGTLLLLILFLFI